MENNLKNRNRDPNCPVRSVLDRIGDKWAVLVITTLGEEGTMRFNQLHETIGDISQKMLTVTLKKLQEDGLVSRRMYQEIPPRVEYTLTDTGVTLVPLLNALAEWANANMKVIKKSRSVYAEVS
ncbi:transcriptional regulator, HxlR family [Chitinophaga sp. YR573]|uniref:winged helix-turn-helix transcriptional regulator n=1 Tax=Chitinophaga sp. YR573 TaxID=1881040 RepID=UPI0008B01023|nr:helix-turn-helix domain-containing protein [Chitinophaga sp. YR573]SEW43352.1 transcriptional regulator, HxlR family [Chitinophaga sp. YR573]